MYYEENLVTTHHPPHNSINCEGVKDGGMSVNSLRSTHQFSELEDKYPPWHRGTPGSMGSILLAIGNTTKLMVPAQTTTERDEISPIAGKSHLEFPTSLSLKVIVLLHLNKFVFG